MLSFELRILELAVLIRTLDSDLKCCLFHIFRNLGKFFTSFCQLMEKILSIVDPSMLLIKSYGK